MDARYKHDCDACALVGAHGVFDVYVCLAGGGIGRSVIARRSSSGSDYASCAVDVFRTCHIGRGHVGQSESFAALHWGLDRAIERGLLERSDVYGHVGSYTAKKEISMRLAGTAFPLSEGAEIRITQEDEERQRVLVSIGELSDWRPTSFLDSFVGPR